MTASFVKRVSILMMLVASLLVTLASLLGGMQSARPASVTLTPTVIYPVKHDLSPELRILQPIAPPTTLEEEVREVPMFALPREGREGALGEMISDPVHQRFFGTEPIPLPIQNFEGVNNVDGVLPPDTEGDVGPNHYVQ